MGGADIRDLYYSPRTGGRQPLAHAILGAAQALVRAGVHDVVPHLTLVAERQVPAANQLVQAGGHLEDIDAERPGKLAGIWRVPRLGERPVHRQPQVLTVHAAILAKPVIIGAARRLSK